MPLILITIVCHSSPMDASPITPDADTSYLDHIPLDHLAIALSRQATQKCQNMTYVTPDLSILVDVLC